MLTLYGYTVSYQNRRLKKRGLLLSFNDIVGANLAIQAKQPMRLLKKYKRSKYNVKQLLRIL